MRKFRIATSCQFNPYIAIGLGASYGIVEDLVQCLSAAIDEVAPYFSDEFLEIASGSVDDSTQRRFREFCNVQLCYQMERGTLFDEYLNNCKSALQENVFFAISEKKFQDLLTYSLGESSPFSSNFVEHYEANWTVERSYLHDGLLALVPFCYFRGHRSVIGAR